MVTTVKLGLTELVGDAISLVGQSVLFGVLLFTFPISVYILARRDRRRSTKALLAMLSTMFTLSFIFWAFRVADLIFLIAILIRNELGSERVHRDVPNVVILVNFVITDGVVVWRAWVINREKRIALLIATMFLILTGLSCILAIIVRVVLQARVGEQSLHKVLNTILNTTQTVNLSLSLLTNIIATGIIWMRAWHFKKDLHTMGQKQTPVERILVLLVESGVIYGVSGLIVVISTVIRSPYGTLGDIIQPIHAMLSGVYPTVVIILVSQRKSLRDDIIASKVHREDNLQRTPTIQSGIRFREITVNSEFTADFSARTPDSPRLRRGKGTHEDHVASNHSRISALNAAIE